MRLRKVRELLSVPPTVVLWKCSKVLCCECAFPLGYLERRKHVYSGLFYNICFVHFIERWNGSGFFWVINGHISSFRLCLFLYLPSGIESRHFWLDISAGTEPVHKTKSTRVRNPCLAMEPFPILEDYIGVILEI